MLFYFLIMVLVFGVLIFIHELGHFLTARANGVYVKEFAIGMGPTLVSWTSKKHGTKYGLRLLPIGGFVSMMGEDEESDDARAFCNKSVPRRMVIVAAGAVMNLLLGFLLMMTLVFSQGTLASNVIGRFDEQAISAEKLEIYDEIIKVGRVRVHTWEETVYEIANQAYEPISMTVKRDGELVVLEEVDVELLVLEDVELDVLELVPLDDVELAEGVVPHATKDTKSIIASRNAMIFFTFLTSFQKGCCSLKFCRILSYYSRF